MDLLGSQGIVVKCTAALFSVRWIIPGIRQYIVLYQGLFLYNVTIIGVKKKTYVIPGLRYIGLVISGFYFIVYMQMTGKVT